MIPGVGFLGLKGAALAAFGERPGGFEGPLTARDEGVKLGESTFNFFLVLETQHEHELDHYGRSCNSAPFRLAMGKQWLDRFMTEWTACRLRSVL